MLSLQAQGEGIDSNQHSFSQSEIFLTTIERQEHGSECLHKGRGVVAMPRLSILAYHDNEPYIHKFLQCCITCIRSVLMCRHDVTGNLSFLMFHSSWVLVSCLSRVGSLVSLEPLPCHLTACSLCTVPVLRHFHMNFADDWSLMFWK